MLKLGSGARDLVIGLGDLLQVVVAGNYWFIVCLHIAALEHFQNYDCVLGVVLVPGIEHRFPITGLCNGGNGYDLHTRSQKVISKCTEIVASRLHSSPATASKAFYESYQMIKVQGSVCHLEAVTLSGCGFYKHRVPVAGYINYNPMQFRLSIRNVSHLEGLIRK